MIEDKELQVLIEENKQALKEMFDFWKTLQSLNKFLRWLVYIGAPIIVGLWAFYKFIKSQ